MSLSVRFSTIDIPKSLSAFPKPEDEVCGICHEPMIGKSVKKRGDIVGHTQHSETHQQTYAVGKEGEKLQHLFHKNCIKPWLDGENPSCPTCRAPVWDERAVQPMSINRVRQEANAPASSTAREVVINIREEYQNMSACDVAVAGLQCCRAVSLCVVPCGMILAFIWAALSSG